MRVIYAVFHSEPLVVLTALRRATLFAFASLSLGASLLAGPLAAQRPTGWKVLADTPADDSLGAYVLMPPGWHLTVGGPGAAVYDPAWTTGTRYALEWDAFVFHTTHPDPFGVFFGGRDLEGPSPTYYAVQLTVTGELGVIQRTGRVSHVIVPSAANPNFVRPPAGDAAENVLRVSVEYDSVRVLLNGKWAAAFVPGGDVSGTFGFRVGTGTNLHVARLDQITPLAPPRPARRSAN